MHQPDLAEAPKNSPGEPTAELRKAGRNWRQVRPRWPRRSLSRRELRAALFLALPLVLLAALLAYLMSGRTMSTDNAYIEAEKVGVSTDVSGVVKEIDVRDNQKVQAGQVLYRLDDLPFRLALDRADAQLGTVRDKLDALKANYSDIQAQIAQAQDDLAYYKREFQRQEYLSKQHVASESTYDTARQAWQNAQHKVAALTAQRGAIIASLNGNPGAPIEQHPLYRDALAQRDEAARQLAHTIVKAPFAGIATKVSAIAPGTYLAASATAFFLVSTDHVWVDANPKETELTHVRPGQPVTVTADIYPDAEWHGTVASISPAAAQEFALLPAQNTSGNWVKVVQRIPIRVRLDTRNKTMPPLRAGMSVEITVDTSNDRGTF